MECALFCFGLAIAIFIFIGLFIKWADNDFPLFPNINWNSKYDYLNGRIDKRSEEIFDIWQRLSKLENLTKDLRLKEEIEKKKQELEELTKEQ